MRKINYGLIISDFDGTLVRRDGEIGDLTKRAIAQYVQDGGRFAISTGRLPYGILPRVRELGLKGLVSCAQGAIIVDIESGKRVLDGKISNEITVAACEKMEQLGLHVHLYDEEDYYSNMDDEGLQAYERAVRVKAKLVTDRPMSVFAKQTGMRSYKILAMMHPRDNQRVMEELKAMQFEGCCVTRSSRTLVEVISASYSKGTTVEFLSKYYQIPLSKIIAVGDQQNDIPMIEKAGLGIAVKNADEELKNKALVFDYTNEEDAIGKIIEKYGYTED